MSQSPSSVSPPHAKSLVIHQNLDNVTLASTNNANHLRRQQGEVVKVWRQVGSIGTHSSNAHDIQESSFSHEFNNSASMEQKTLSIHKLMVEKLEDVLNIIKDNS